MRIWKCENGWRMESVRRDFKDVLLRYEGGVQINDWDEEEGAVFGNELPVVFATIWLWESPHRFWGLITRLWWRCWLLGKKHCSKPNKAYLIRELSFMLRKCLKKYRRWLATKGLAGRATCSLGFQCFTIRSSSSATTMMYSSDLFFTDLEFVSSIEIVRGRGGGRKWVNVRYILHF